MFTSDSAEVACLHDFKHLTGLANREVDTISIVSR